MDPAGPEITGRGHFVGLTKLKALAADVRAFFQETHSRSPAGG